MKTGNAKVTFLVVDDNDLDQEKIRRSFAKLRVENPIVRACDGIEALELLRGENGVKALCEPYVVLLDINMPRMNGLECLHDIRNDPTIAKARVFVLTSSDRPDDVEAAQKFDVAGYGVKPLRKEELVNVFAALTYLGNGMRTCFMPEPATGRSLWLVDDDDLFAERVSRNLRGTSWTFSYFEDADTALAQITSLPAPDLVIADLNMPGTDGIAMLTIAADTWKNTPVRLHLTSEIAPIGKNLDRLRASGLAFHSKDIIADKAALLDLLGN